MVCLLEATKRLCRLDVYQVISDVWIHGSSKYRVSPDAICDSVSGYIVFISHVTELANRIHGSITSTQAEYDWVEDVAEVLEDDSPGKIWIMDELPNEAVEKLASMIEGAPDKVKGLNVFDTKMSAVGTARLCKALEKCTELRSLNMQGCEVGESGGKLVAAVIAGCPKLFDLDLTGCKLGDEGASAIAEAAAKSESMVSVDFSKNGITDEGVKHMAESLKSTAMMGSIKLSGNAAVSAGGAAALVTMLQGNSEMELVDLSGCSIGNEGLAAVAGGIMAGVPAHIVRMDEVGADDFGPLAEALRGNKTIDTLSISKNKVGDEGAKALAAALQEGTAVERLSMERCGIGAEGAAALLEAAKAEGSKLESIQLDGNDDIPGEVKEAIEAACD